MFANDNIRYRNKQRIIRNLKIKEIKKLYSYCNMLTIYNLLYTRIYINTFFIFRKGGHIY